MIQYMFQYRKLAVEEKPRSEELKRWRIEFRIVHYNYLIESVRWRRSQYLSLSQDFFLKDLAKKNLGKISAGIMPRSCQEEFLSRILPKSWQEFEPRILGNLIVVLDVPFKYSCQDLGKNSCQESWQEFLPRFLTRIFVEILDKNLGINSSQDLITDSCQDFCQDLAKILGFVPYFLLGIRSEFARKVIENMTNKGPELLAKHSYIYIY